MDNYLEKIQDKNNLIDKIAKIQKVLIKILIILLFIRLYLLIFKNIFILKLFCLIPMIIISIISIILTFKTEKLRNEILKLSREFDFMLTEKTKKIKNELLELSREAEKRDK